MIKKILTIVFAVLLVVSVGVSVFMSTGSAKLMNPKKVTVVSTPNQTKASTPKQFQSKTVSATQLQGTNLALNKRVYSNGYTQVYDPKNATDGSDTSYWEGQPNSYPDEITVDLAKASSITAIRLKLNPAAMWGKRTQEIEVKCSDDNNTYTELVAKAKYTFDPGTGNYVDIPLKSGTKTRYVQLIFTSNTQATGGQVAEAEIYGSAS